MTAVTWIKCSERMPSRDDKLYNTFWLTLVDSRGDRVVVQTSFNTVQWSYPDWPIIAWAECYDPEPYEGLA
jgi:hypothetical protein